MTPQEKANFLLPDRFRPQLVLGEGAFGVVSKCWDMKLQRNVAIKTPRRVSVDQDIFLREARAASQIDHPNVVRIYDVGNLEGQAFIVSEYVDGPTLRIWMNGKKLNPLDVCRVIASIARGVAAAHEVGVVHRDLKPGNILINKSGEPRIVDFGLSHSRRVSDEDLNVEGKPVGTPAYMPPEQAAGSLTSIGPWSDVYSVGIIMYEMLTGKLPFRGAATQVMQCIMHVEPSRPRELSPEIPAPLEAICLKAISKDWEKRYATASDFAADLEAYDKGGRLLAYPRPYGRRFVSIVRQNLVRLLIVACGSLLAWGLTIMLADRGTQKTTLLPVVIKSMPEGAEVKWIPFDFLTGEFAVDRITKSTAGGVVQLEPGFYKLTCQSGSETIEVFRTVPAQIGSPTLSHFVFGGTMIKLNHRMTSDEGGKVRLEPVTFPDFSTSGGNQAEYSGGLVEFGSNPRAMQVVAGKTARIGRFQIDRREITWSEMKRVFPDIKIPPGTDPESSAAGVPIDIALAFAEACGRSLPSVFELEIVATNELTTRFPWGEEPIAFENELSDSDVAGWDSTLKKPEVSDLYGGLSEWTENLFVARVIDPETGLPYSLGEAGPFGVTGMPGLSAEAWLVLRAQQDGKRSLVERLNPVGSDQKNGLGFRTVRRLAIEF